jgi:hypothetical protein
MDKHDRPYKCNAKGCEYLQGFTYSGGLVRHEREVHKMHGGTKKSLFCLYPDCERSSGAGFARRENLAEHIRRVHRKTSMSTDLGSNKRRRIVDPPERDGDDMRADIKRLWSRIQQLENAQVNSALSSVTIVWAIIGNTTSFIVWEKHCSD